MDAIASVNEQREQISSAVRRIALAAAVFCLLLTSPCTAMQDAEGTDETLTAEQLLKAVEDLDAPEYETREHATRQLQSARWRAEDLARLLELPDLTIEQRERLIGAWYERKVYRPRGALGITQQWVPDEQGIYGSFEISGFVRDLPAERFLELRDRVTHYDGRRPVRQEELADYVLGKWPGDVVVLTVERIVRNEIGEAKLDEDGQVVRKTLQIDLPLGSAQNLLDPRTGMPELAIAAQRRAHNEARKLLSLYSTRSERITFSPRVELDSLPSQSRLEELVDQHRTIALVKRELDFIDEGRMRYDDALATWDGRLQQLRAQIEDPSTTDAEREFLTLVVERFLKLTQYNRNANGG